MSELLGYILESTTEIYSIVDLCYENEFLRAISHRRRSLRCEVIRNSSQAKHINNSMFTEDLLRRHHYSVTLKTVILICSYHDSCLITDIITCKDPFSCLIIDIITCKDQRENVPIIDR